MRWIKASEELPTKQTFYHARTGTQKIPCILYFDIDESFRSEDGVAINLSLYEWLDETESPSDSEAVDTESPVQYGTAFEADCEDGTWTFKMDEPFYVMAGRFKIIPLKK